MTVTTETLSVHTCANCGVTYGMTAGYEDRRREDHQSWYCPNGHSQWYPQKSDLDKAKEKAAQLERNLAYARDHAAAESARADQASASLRTTKGHLTRLRKRAVAGTCPFGCGRHFENLERHVASKHPDHVLETGAE